MKTPKEKYMNDPEYNRLVNMLERLIAQAQFTPSELREACILASINYEVRNIRYSNIDPKLEDAPATGQRRNKNENMRRMRRTGKGRPTDRRCPGM